MATIVRQRPYNDWREQLALGVITPIINGVIERSIESAKNRKLNAAMAQTLSELQNSQQGSITANPAASGGLLAGMAAPEGYNSDSWAQAFHKQYTPLTQFDMGTADTAPQIPNTAPSSGNAWQQALSKSYNPLAEFDANTADITPADIVPQMNAFQTNQPTKQDILQKLYAVMGNKRFSHLNANDVLAQLNPYIQATEQAQAETQRKELADSYMNAPDWDTRLNLMTGGAIQGIVPESMRNGIWEGYKYDNPYMQTQSYNDGANAHFISTNPRTGEMTDTLQIQNQLSPKDILDNSYRMAKLQAYIANNNANRGLEYYKTDTEYGYKGKVHDDTHGLQKRQQNFTEENTRYEREHPELGTLESTDGSVFFYNKRTGQVTEAITPDGKRITKPSSGNLYVRQEPDGTFIVIDPKRGTASTVTKEDGTQAKGTLPKSSTTTTNPNRDLTDKEKLEYNANLQEAKELRKERADAQEKANFWADEPDSPQYKAAVKELERIDNRLNELRQRQSEILNGPKTSSGDVKPDNSNSVEDNSPVMWVSKDGKRTVTQDQYYFNKYLVETGQHSKFKTVKEFEAAVREGYNRVNSTMSSDKTAANTISSDDMKQALPPMSSMDNVPQVSSADIKPSSQDIKPKTNGNVEFFSLKDLPQEMFYDPERDKNISPDNIVTPQQLAGIIQKMMNKNPLAASYMTPLLIAYQLFKQKGLRIKV